MVNSSFVVKSLPEVRHRNLFGVGLLSGGGLGGEGRFWWGHGGWSCCALGWFEGFFGVWIVWFTQFIYTELLGVLGF